MDVQDRLNYSYATQPVLITGGASFIGSHLAETLIDAGALVTVADDLSSGSLENLGNIKSRIRFLNGDPRDPQFAKAATDGQAIIFTLLQLMAVEDILKPIPLHVASTKPEIYAPF
jgi:nucleoside-diphosphate-sugar epimerase